jgi:hypothetical protein
MSSLRFEAHARHGPGNDDAARGRHAFRFAAKTAAQARHLRCPRLKPGMLPWNAARYFYSMADRMMLV